MTAVSAPRARLVAVVAALAILVALPGVAAADTASGPPSIPAAHSSGATIEIKSPAGVTARLIATVDVSFTCEPFQVFDWETGQTTETTAGRIEWGQVVVLQAQGRQIAWGTADFYGGDVTCDGSFVNARTLGVVASNLPWKSGVAVAGANVAVSDLDFGDFHTAGTGPVEIKLVRR